MLKMLRDITQSMALSNCLEDALDLLVKRTKQAMSSQYCSVYILEQQRLVLTATDGLETDLADRICFSVNEGLIGLVVQQQGIINLAQAHKHPSFKTLPNIEDSHLNGFLAAPIIYQKRVTGVIVVRHIHSRQFTENEEAFLMTLATQLALILHHFKHKTLSCSVVPMLQTLRQGKCISGGIAIAPGLVLGGEISLERPYCSCDDIASEVFRLEQALSRSKEALNRVFQQFEHGSVTEVSAIVSTLLELLSEHSLGGEYIAKVRSGWQAESAVSRVTLDYMAQFSVMDDTYLKERSRDIRELGLRVLRQLIEPDKLQSPDNPVILVVREADTGLLAEFPPQKLAGVVAQYGGINSHAAIVARALGVPALIGVDQLFDFELDGKLLVVNANQGQLLVNPSDSVIREYRAIIASESMLKRHYAAELSLPTITLDKHRVFLYLNAGLVTGMDNQVIEGADGIGLYRSEIPFVIESIFPDESEQFKVYRSVLQAAQGRPVVMRTLDIGGDKTLPYLPVKEENPFLGWRGIRFSLDHPELFLLQMRSMMLASVGEGSLSIILPMVSSIEEIDAAKVYFNQAYTEVKHELGHGLRKPKLGIMLEVPALVYQLREVAKRVDFISIGTNDLTQYLLAVDRNNPKVSRLFDSYHPGILAILQQIRLDCQQYGLDVSVCGELAGESIGALLLVAMGYRQLSMNQGSLARINYLLRRVSLDELENLLSMALELIDGQDVRELVLEYINSKNLIKH